MQAKLPDINAAFVKYRSHFLISIEIPNFSAATASLNGINALLPDEYKVEINTEKYNAAIKTKLLAICPNCKKEIQSKDVKVFDLLLNSIDSLMCGSQTIKMWPCPECHKDNEISKTSWTKDVIQLPAYNKVIPEPPQCKNGLDNRMKYEKEMTSWCYLFLEEIEYQLGIYRREFVAQSADADQLVEQVGEEFTDYL